MALSATMAQVGTDAEFARCVCFKMKISVYFVCEGTSTERPVLSIAGCHIYIYIHVFVCVCVCVSMCLCL